MGAVRASARFCVPLLLVGTLAARMNAERLPKQRNPARPKLYQMTGEDERPQLRSIDKGSVVVGRVVHRAVFLFTVFHDW